jgi:putative acetyltransferase
MLRPSRKSDLEQLFAIWHDAVKATHHFLNDGAFAEIAQLVKDDYLPSKQFLVFAIKEDVPLVFMGTEGNEIESLFIHPEQHGKGIGKIFVDHMKAAHSTVVLEVNEQNPQAVGFYEAAGFKLDRRDPTDRHGRPFPILHMSWHRS